MKRKTKVIRIIGPIVLMVSFSAFAVKKKEASVKESIAKPKMFSKEEVAKMVKLEVKRRLKMLKKGEFVRFTSELFEKEEKIKLAKISIEKKENLLKNSKLSFNKQIKDFHKEQTKYLSCRSQTHKRKDKRIRHMVDVISGMKPLNASKILSVQDAKIAIDILSRLDAVKVSKIFNLMDKEISARLQKQYMTMQE